MPNDLKDLEFELGRLNKKAIPFATRAAINSIAFEIQKEARKTIDEKFVNRNKFTKQSVRVERSRTLNMRSQEALVGSIADYMATQEFGGTAKGRGNQPIATSVSAGQSESTRPRTRLPRRPNRMQSIQLKRRARGSQSRRQRNKAAAMITQ